MREERESRAKLLSGEISGLSAELSVRRPDTPTPRVQPRAMTKATFRVIVARSLTAIGADRVSRGMTYRPTSCRQRRWKRAWTELSKEAVWLAIVQGRVELEAGVAGR